MSDFMETPKYLLPKGTGVIREFTDGYKYIIVYIDGDIEILENNSESLLYKKEDLPTLQLAIDTALKASSNLETKKER